VGKKDERENVNGKGNKVLLASCNNVEENGWHEHK